jgi:outer membrane biosynthesis protein TonB
MEERRFRLWVGVSLGLHVLFVAAMLLELDRRRIEEPPEIGIAVELVGPAEMAQGEQLAPRPAVDPVPQPPRPEPQPELPRTQAQVQPPPPPPPPPPAPAPSPVQAPPVPRPQPAPPPPDAAPSPSPVPRPQQQAQAPTPPTPAPPTPAPPRPQPPLPLPPPRTPPPPTPAQTPGTGQTPPVQRPEERSQSVLNTLERLRQQQQQQQAPTARANPAPASPAQGGGAPTGAGQLTAAERAGIAERIGECWSVDAGAQGLRDIVVEFRIEADAQGIVRRVTPVGGPPANPQARMVFEAARRALLDARCNPLPLPRGGVDALNAATYRFNPRDVGLR